MSDQSDRLGVLGRLRRPGQPLEPRDDRADTDPITGLPARSAFFDWVTQAVERSAGDSNRAVVAFCDIGLVRDVNDSFGPDVGDLLLRQVGDRLRSIDLPGTQVLRWEGAEFALVFEQIPHVEQAEVIARFLIDLLTPPFDLGVEHVTVAPRVGAALSADNYHNMGEFIRDAHQALVSAREDGAGWIVHDESKRGRYETRIDERRLFDAIESHEFILHYQPIFRLDTKQLVGVEALVRWKDPSATNSGLVSPGDFLPLLEKSGLSVKLGRWILEEACRQAAAWNALFPERSAILVTANIGPRQLASTEFHDTVVEAITGSGVAPWQLCLDITESALRFNRSSSWSSLRTLKEYGVKLGLDDFGTGVSSLAYLREFALDLLRLDRTFISGLAVNREDRVIVKHMVALAHDLGIVAIAEGVEHPEQAEILDDLKVDLGQGFHYGRPMPPEGIVELLDPSLLDKGEQWTADQVLSYPTAAEDEG